MLGASVGSSLLELLSSKWVLANLDATTVPRSPSLPIHAGWAACGLLVLVLAGRWCLAVRMSEEQALTV